MTVKNARFPDIFQKERLTVLLLEAKKLKLNICTKRKLRLGNNKHQIQT